MSLSRTGAYLPNGNFLPKQYSAYMQAIYHGTHVVPLIANRDYDGDINKPGDTVYIRKKPSISTFDYTIGQDLEKQASLADDVITLSIDYGTYFNVPINDVDEFLSDIDIQLAVADEGAVAIGDKIEQRVLQTIYASGTTTLTASALDSSTAIKYFRQAAMSLQQLNVPDNDLWAVIDPITYYFITGSSLNVATTTGGINKTLNTYKVEGKIAGFDVYVSNNLLAGTSTSKILFGHRDALAFASKFQKAEVVRDTKDFADLLRTLVVYGFKVVKPDAMGCINVTSFGTL